MDAQETSIYVAVLAAGLILGIIILYFAISIIRQQRNNIALYRKSIRAEITTLEKERTRMAKDLHDELGPMLSVIKFYVDNPASDKQERQEQSRLVSNSVDDVINRIREIAGNLTPTLLIKKGLIAAIRDFAEDASQAASVSIRFQHKVYSELPSDLSINIYRIIQEGVHNALKHSHCTEIIIQIKEQEQQLFVVCQDNGIGYDQHQALNQKNGVGLMSLKSRTEVLEGQMHVKTKPGLGTFLLFIIPLNKSR